MGDNTETTTNENQNESPQNANCGLPTPSIDILKEAKPSENIAIIIDTTEKVCSSPVVNIEATLKASRTSDITLKATPESRGKLTDTPIKILEELKNDKAAIETVQKQSDDAIKLKEKASLKNRSDIFSLNENKNLPCTIFSVGGVPSKNVHKTTSNNSDKTSSSSDTLSSSASRQSNLRNPVTGIGVSSNDEYKNKNLKRRDGNPLLGTGYKDDEQFFNSPKTKRIPPGGYSNGLW